MTEIIICIGSLFLMSLYDWGLAAITAWLTFGALNSIWYIHHLDDIFSDMEKGKAITLKVALYLGGLTWPFNCAYILLNKQKHLNDVRKAIRDDEPGDIS